MHYNRSTGNFTWLIKPSRRYPVGMRAGSAKPDSRVSIGINRIEYKAHRLAWFYVTGRWPKNEIDHKNGNNADNRFRNLRKATHAQNMRNRKIQSNNTSGIKGVYWLKRTKRWKAQISLNRKAIHLGYFSTRTKAARAYAVAAKKYHMEFVRRG